MRQLRALVEPAVMVLLFQTAYRWPGLLGGAPEAISALLLPALLVRAMRAGRPWWALWLSMFVSVGLLTVWMPPTIAAKGGIPAALSWFAGLLLWAYDSLPPVAALLLAAAVWKRLPGWRGVAASACVAALAVVACDTWLLHIYPWTWATPLASPPLLGRAAAFLGTEGLTAVVWAHGVVAGSLLASGARRAAALSAISALGLLLALSGAWGLLPRGPELSLDIALVQPNYPVNTRIPNQLADMWGRSDELLLKDGLPGNGRPTLLLWPESSLTDGNYLMPAPYLAGIAEARGVAWLFGTDGWQGGGPPQNLVRGEAAGREPFIQAKAVPMPFGERMPGPEWMRVWLESIVGFRSWAIGELSPASSFSVPAQAGGAIRVHPMICSEALLPPRLRNGLALAGGELLTEHTNDAWFETSLAADLHASLVRLRAIEAGAPMVRATMSGRSGLVREDGTWRHISGVMTEGAWSFGLEWRPIGTPARTHWPFRSLLALLVCIPGALAWSAGRKEGAWPRRR